MLRRSVRSDRERVFRYIGEDFSRCLRLYLHYQQYAYQNENVRVWIAEDEYDELTGIFLLCCDCLHIYSRAGKRAAAEAAHLIAEVHPRSMYTTPEFYEECQNIFKDELAKTYVPRSLAAVEKIKTFHRIEGVRTAEEEELGEVAEFLLTDPVCLSRCPSADRLEKQLKNRKQTGYGETFVAKENGKIFYTASIIAQNKRFAIESLVLLAPEYRGRGMEESAIAAGANLTIEKGKRCFCFPAESELKQQLDLGYLYSGDIVKLVKQTSSSEGGKR